MYANVSFIKLKGRMKGERVKRRERGEGQRGEEGEVSGEAGGELFLFLTF